MNYKNSIQDISILFDLKDSRPYLFRTRLERTLIRIKAEAKKQDDNEIFNLCTELMNKVKCISDHSNQTPDGTLKSFLYLEKDLINLKQKVEI